MTSADAAFGSIPFGRAPDGRKLSAIVYADVVGYSRLIGFDDTGTVARLQRLRKSLIDPVVHEYGGRVAQTGGDSLLIFFESIEGAVQCALKVQRLVPDYDDEEPADRQIRFRIGVNIGDVITEGTDFHGDGINIAARLEAECPTGAVCVTRAIRDHVKGLDYQFEDLGALALKNIARPIEAYVLRTTDLCENPRSPSFSATGAPRSLVVVLPFDDLTDGAAHSVLSDCITDDLTTSLARIVGKSVVSRQTALAYKGKSVDAKRLGRELGVRYVIQGSVRQIGAKLRVNVQLLDAESGYHIWVDRFDVDCASSADRYDEVVARLVRTLHLAILSATSLSNERHAAARIGRRELVSSGWAAMNCISQKSFQIALSYFENALATEPGSTDAQLGTAYALLTIVSNGWSTSPEDDKSRAERLLQGPAERNPNDATVHLAMGLLRRLQDRLAEAQVEWEAAIALNPDNPIPYCELGATLLYSGLPEAAVPNFEKAIRINPFDPGVSAAYTMLGLSLILLHKIDDAIGTLRKACTANPRLYYAHLFLAAALSLAEETEAAKAALAEAVRLDPDIVMRLRTEWRPTTNRRYEELADATLWVGLRKTGILAA